MPQKVVPREDVAVDVDFGIWIGKRLPGFTARGNPEAYETEELANTSMLTGMVDVVDTGQPG
jgi:hypothetical protein